MPAVRGARHARLPPAAAPRDADGAGRPAPRRRQGDHAAQPPRLVELPLLPRLRARVAVPQLRGRAGAAPSRGRSSPATTAAIASGCPIAAAACASVSVARHGAGTERIEHELREALGDDGFPVFRLDADAADAARARRDPAALRATRPGRAGRHPDGGQGPRLPRRLAGGRDRRRPDAALPGLPRRGADVRARHPAGRPHRARGARRRPGAGADAGARRPLDRVRRPPRRRRVHRRRAGAPPGAALPAVRVADPGRLLGRGRGDAGCTRPPRSRELIAVAGRRVLGPAPLFRLRGRARSQVVVKASDRAPAIEAVGRAVDAVAPAAARRGVSVSVDVDPQIDAAELRSTRVAGETANLGTRLRREPRHRSVDEPDPDELEVDDTDPDEEERARSRGRRPPHGGAGPRAQVRRPGAADQGPAGRSLRRRAARPGPADGRADERRARRRPGRHPGRGAQPRAGLPRPPAGAVRRAGQPRDRVVRLRGGDHRGGLPQPSRRPRRRRAPGERPRHARSTSTASRSRSRRPAWRRA